MQQTIEPHAGTMPSDDLKDHDFGLFFDGKRVRASAVIETRSGGVELRVTFTTSVSALTNPSVDPTDEIAWAGWKAGDTAHLRQPLDRKMPENGMVMIRRIQRASVVGQETMFACKALTDVYDYSDGGTERICGAGQFCAVPFSWFPTR